MVQGPHSSRVRENENARGAVKPPGEAIFAAVVRVDFIAADFEGQRTGNLKLRNAPQFATGKTVQLRLEVEEGLAQMLSDMKSKQVPGSVPKSLRTGIRPVFKSRLTSTKRHLKMAAFFVYQLRQVRYGPSFVAG